MSDDDHDELDPDVLLGETPPDAEAAEPPNPTNTCDYVGDDGVCGESFDTPLKLGLHRRNVHGIAGKWSKENRGKGGDKAPSKSTGRRKKAPAEKKAATTAAGPVSDRAGTYTASLAMAGLACYFALPPFTQADLDVVNAGAPNLGRALGNLADHNASVARATDLILGGGAGGDWIAVVMAVTPMVGAIAANHGLVPPTSGQRFGAMLGLAPLPPTPERSQPSDAAAEHPASSNGYNPESVEDVIVFMSGIPPTVMTDAMSRMMTMDAPVEVSVPFTRTVTENPDGHTGSEQLRPVEPTAEQEPAPAV